MRLSTNTATPLKLYTLEELIHLAADAGFDALDYSEFDKKLVDEATDSEEHRAWLISIRELAESKGIRFNQAHAPFPTSFADPARTEEMFGHVVRSMRNAALLGVEIIVVHPMQHLNYADDGNPEALFEMNMDFYRRLEPYCKEFGIKVAVENMWQQPVGKKIVRSTCATPEEFIRYVDTLNSEWFVACLDIGHACLVCEDPADFIRKLGGKRLKSLHVHDVDGMVDSHTLPYYGVVNWEKVALALKEIGYDGDFTFEADHFLSHLPKALYPTGLKHMAATGRYLMDLMK